MTARQTIIRVRSDQTDLSATVASLLPSAMADARRSIRRESGPVWTTFCPICGGNKLKSSMRCATCRNRVMHDGKAKAKAAGHQSSGRSSSARSLIGEAVVRNNPDRGDHQSPAPTWARRVRGEGRAHIQSWDRKLLVDGKWIAESETPDGLERKRLDDEAIRRLGVNADSNNRS